MNDDVLSGKLKLALKKSSFKNEIHDIFDYALFPNGKLIRPRMTMAIAQDYSSSTSMNDNTYYWALAIELHHNYTLIHDDLPAMDNDDWRRGKYTVHKQFNEWKAILAGDALLISSFELLHQLETQYKDLLLKIFTKSVGAKGLILGQWMDLSHWPTTSDFSRFIKLHELKTARLFQLAIFGSYCLNHATPNLKTAKELWRLGFYLGIYFQLIDDLEDGPDANQHEQMISLTKNFPKESMEYLERAINKMNETLQKHQLKSLQIIIQNYHTSKQDLFQRHQLLLPTIL